MQFVLTMVLPATPRTRSTTRNPLSQRQKFHLIAFVLLATFIQSIKCTPVIDTFSARQRQKKVRTTKATTIPVAETSIKNLKPKTNLHRHKFNSLRKKMRNVPAFQTRLSLFMPTASRATTRQCRTPPTQVTEACCLDKKFNVLTQPIGSTLATNAHRTKRYFTSGGGKSNEVETTTAKDFMSKSKKDALSSSDIPSKPFMNEEEEKKRIFITNPKHGFRIDPFSWSELKLVCCPERGDLSLLCRYVMEEYKYKIYRRQLNSFWKSMVDHILCSKFQFERRVDEQDGLYYAYPSLDDLRKGEFQEYSTCSVVLPNDFPYFVEEGIEHWVLWKLQNGASTGESNSCCNAEDIEQAKRTIEMKKKETSSTVVKDFIHWINPPHLKSVPEIDHVHILCLLQPAADTTSDQPEP